MKVAEKVVLLVNGGVAAAVATGLHPGPGSHYQKRIDSFAFPLDCYGIKDEKACGEIIHYIKSDGHYEVSILILQNYEPPILACALNECLLKLSEEKSSASPSLTVPLLVPESKLKQDSKFSIKSDNVSVYGIQLGPTTDVAEALVSKLQKPSPFLQIYHEELAVLLHLVKPMKIPTLLLIAQTRQHISNQASEDTLEVICQIGDLLASITSLVFSKEKMVQAPIKSSKDSNEAWRALYG